jgi:hypothetical protein
MHVRRASLGSAPPLNCGVRRHPPGIMMMRKVERKSSQTEVAQTGRIPVGTDVHQHRLRNPNIGYLVRVIRETKALMSSGECHPDWGSKRIEALQKMLDAKRIA